MSFLSVFQTVLHGIEAAVQLAAPIIATQDKTIGALMQMAVQTAVTIEAAVPTKGTGAQKAAAVAAQTSAAIGLVNAIRAAQGHEPLAAGTLDLINATVKSTVAGLNAVSASAPALPAPAAEPGV